jgi:hypothetical protein
MGGASLGPEKALGSTVGGLGSWLSRRRGLTDDQIETNTFSGFAGAYGGLLSSPVVVVMLILELSRPGGEKFTRILVNTAIAASVSFGVYFAIAGSVFLDLYPVPPYTFESWQLLVGVALGIVAAGLAMGVVLTVAVMTQVFARSRLPRIAKPVIGGIAFGLIGVALPLTMFTGTDQLDTVLADASGYGPGAGPCVDRRQDACVCVSQASGFVGGPIFPALFIGGTAGIAVNLLFPGIPLALAFSCMLAAVVGGLASAPFAMVLLAGLLTQVGALQSAPILLAVISSYATVEGTGFLVNLAKRARAQSECRAAGAVLRLSTRTLAAFNSFGAPRRGSRCRELLDDRPTGLRRWERRPVARIASTPQSGPSSSGVSHSSMTSGPRWPSEPWRHAVPAGAARQVSSGRNDAGTGLRLPRTVGNRLVEADHRSRLIRQAANGRAHIRTVPFSAKKTFTRASDSYRVGELGAASQVARASRPWSVIEYTVRFRLPFHSSRASARPASTSRLGSA